MSCEPSLPNPLHPQHGATGGNVLHARIPLHPCRQHASALTAAGSILSGLRARYPAQQARPVDITAITRPPCTLAAWSGRENRSRLARALARGCRDRPEIRAIYFGQFPSMAEPGAWNINHLRLALLSLYFAFIYLLGGQNVTESHMHYAQSRPRMQ